MVLVEPPDVVRESTEPPPGRVPLDGGRGLFEALRNLFWWFALLVTLVILDDLVFGPIAWLIAQVNPWLAAVVGFSAMWGLSYWLVLVGVRPQQGRVARLLLSRLQLERRNPRIREREATLKAHLTSVAVAVPMSLLFGGVVTSLWLYKREVVDERQVRRLAFWLTALYACEFVILHAFGGGRVLAELLDAL
jgi:hypothetical protein